MPKILYACSLETARTVSGMVNVNCRQLDLVLFVLNSLFLFVYNVSKYFLYIQVPQSTLYG